MEENKQRPGVPGNDNKNPRKGPRFNIYWIYGIILLAILAVQFFGSSIGNSNKEYSFQEFRLNYLDQNKVDHLVVVNNDEVEVYLRPSAMAYQPNNKTPLNFNNDKSYAFSF